ncbi:MAG: DUF2933 domain-containing protein [Blastocatellia bacterium]|nr:DUF2933 domain-containing protein [Blastocatellia bacterium]
MNNKEGNQKEDHAPQKEDHAPQTPGLFQTRAGWALLVFLGIAGFFLWTEHRAHLFGILPFLLLLLCPLLHLFLHRGHGSHSGGGKETVGEGEHHRHKSQGGGI